MRISKKLKPYIKNIQPPYTKKKIVPLTATLLLLIVPLVTIVLIARYAQTPKERARGQAVSFTGTVFVDANNNGEKDIGEPNYSGATISLEGDAVASAQSDDNGNYVIPNVSPGKYNIYLKVPQDYNATRTVSYDYVDAGGNYDFGIIQEIGTKELYSDTFTADDGVLLENYNSKWSQVNTPEKTSGSAIIINNELTVSTENPYYWYRLNQPEYNGCISADVKWPVKGMTEFSLRQTDANNRAYLYINPDSDIPGGTDFGMGTVISYGYRPTVSGTFLIPDGMHNVKFCDFNDGIKRLYIDGVLKLDSPLQDNNMTIGSPSIMTKGAVIDNVKFTHDTVPSMIPQIFFNPNLSLTTADNGTFDGGIVTFTDPDSVMWTAVIDFGDGTEKQTLSLREKSFQLRHEYRTSGEFTVTVNVSDDQGNTGSATEKVTVLSAPKITGLSKVDLNPGETFNINGSFTDTDSNSWTGSVDYGDGTGVRSLELNGKTFTLDHVYQNGGALIVNVFIKDDQGITGVGSFPVIINQPPYVGVIQNAVVNAGEAYNAEVEVADTDSSTSWTAKISYGDGTPEQMTSLTPTPEGIMSLQLNHVYAQAGGPHTVLVSVTDNQGLTSTNTGSVVVNAAPVIAPFDGAEIFDGQLYNSSTSFTDPDSHSWTVTVNYGDGNSINTTNAGPISLNHTYYFPGTKTVTVTVKDENNATSTQTADVIVKPAYVPVLTITSPYETIRPGQTFTDTVTVQNMTSQSFATVNYNDEYDHPEEYITFPLTSNTFTISHVYQYAGTYFPSVYVQNKDTDKISDTTYYEILVTGEAEEKPVITFSDAQINEGSTYSTTGSVTGVSSDATGTVDFGDGSGQQAVSLSGDSFALDHEYKDNGKYIVTVSITNSGGTTGEGTAMVTVNNQNPAVKNVTLAPSYAAVKTNVKVSASFTDPGVYDTHVAEVNWGDGTTTPAGVTESDGSGTVSATHNYAKAGYYTVEVSVADRDSGTGMSTQIIPVYAATATGSFLAAYNRSMPDTYTSPAGSYIKDKSATGQANVLVNLKYNKGVPSGTTTMKFPAKNMNFAAKSYQWLVVANGKGYLKGSGTLNGASGYTFFASGLDMYKYGKGMIRFQIKDSSGKVVYDTQPGALETVDPVTVVSKGQVVIKN